MAAGNWILIGMMIAVLVVLVAGILLMARGGAANQKYGNKLMTIRVSLQALALLVLGALFLLKDA